MNLGMVIKVDQQGGAGLRESQNERGVGKQLIVESFRREQTVSKCHPVVSKLLYRPMNWKY